MSGIDRLTFVQQASRNPHFARKIGEPARGHLALVVNGPQGIEQRLVNVLPTLATILSIQGVTVEAFTPLGHKIRPEALIGKTPEECDALARQIDLLMSAALGRRPQLEFKEEMVDLGDGVSISKNPVPVWLFREVMMGYEFKGPNAEKLIKLLADPKKENEAVTWVSLEDGREFAKRLSARALICFEIPTEPELRKAKIQLLGDKDNFIWASTEDEDYPEDFVLLSLAGSSHHTAPFTRSSDFELHIVRKSSK